MYETLCWFSLSQYPATAFEVWKWLWKPDKNYTLSQVYDVLVQSVWLKDRMQEQDGFYAFPPLHKGGQGGVFELVAERRMRFADAERKFAKLRRALGWLARVPTVRAVAAVNTLAWWNTHAGSDIDLFIVARPGTIWMTRALLVLPFAFLKRRPAQAGGHGNEPRDPFCFSFFTITDELQMAALQIEKEDPYLAYWTRSVVPVLDRDDVFDLFEKKNAWVREVLPHASGRMVHREHGRALWSLLMPTFLLRASETFAKRLQERRFPAEIRRMANQDSRVVMSDRMLKFHVNDARAQFRDRFDELTRV